MAPKRICPLEGNSELPALKMQPMYDLVHHVWRMELAQADIYVGPEYDDPVNPASERLAGVPLSGLDVKLVERHLHVRRMLNMVQQMLAHEDWENAPLYLVSRKEKAD